jgi:hypothetical protein
MVGKEAAMIELTEQQVRAVVASGETPPVVVDPTTKTAYVLLRKDIYEQLTSEPYDDSPWTDEEMDLLAAEVDRMLDDDMAVEDPAA